MLTTANRDYNLAHLPQGPYGVSANLPHGYTLLLGTLLGIALTTGLL